MTQLLGLRKVAWGTAFKTVAQRFAPAAMKAVSPYAKNMGMGAIGGGAYGFVSSGGDWGATARGAMGGAAAAGVARGGYNFARSGAPKMMSGAIAKGMNSQTMKKALPGVKMELGLAGLGNVASHYAYSPPVNNQIQVPNVNLQWNG
jgi:hypothetical protein